LGDILKALTLLFQPIHHHQDGFGGPKSNGFGLGPSKIPQLHVSALQSIVVSGTSNFMT
jgi:hypothetical protein